MWERIIMQFEKAANSVIEFWLDKGTGRPLGEYEEYIGKHIYDALENLLKSTYGVIRCSYRSGVYNIVAINGLTEISFEGRMEIRHINGEPVVRFLVHGPNNKRFFGEKKCPVAQKNVANA